jgi:hypothetical protein
VPFFLQRVAQSTPGKRINKSDGESGSGNQAVEQVRVTGDGSEKTILHLQHAITRF